MDDLGLMLGLASENLRLRHGFASGNVRLRLGLAAGMAGQLAVRGAGQLSHGNHDVH